MSIYVSVKLHPKLLLLVSENDALFPEMLHLTTYSNLIYLHYILYHLTLFSILCNCWLQRSCLGRGGEEQLGGGGGGWASSVGGRRLHGSRENADQTANYYAVTTGETKAVRQRHQRADIWGV